ncbi:MAG: RNHCP domain-containing protein [Alphaproteobacteria bacterium]|nr:RNHCP domain-containing protein [Alphaproteobacteria bacterium]
MQHAKFTRKKEDFTCEVCGLKVHGNGYTNHCPRCLSSKHVDIQPGDRACPCKGIMLATGFELKHGTEYIIHTCQTCGHQRANKVSAQDDRSAVIALSCGKMTTYLASLISHKK